MTRPPAAPGWLSAPTLAVLGALALPGLAWLAMKAVENPRLACAAARGLCSELAPVAVASEGGSACPVNTVPLEGGCWIEVKPGPPCQSPAVLKGGRCWVLHTPPRPSAGVPHK